MLFCSKANLYGTCEYFSVIRNASCAPVKKIYYALDNSFVISETIC